MKAIFVVFVSVFAASLSASAAVPRQQVLVCNASDKDSRTIRFVSDGQTVQTSKGGPAWAVDEYKVDGFQIQVSGRLRVHTTGRAGRIEIAAKRAGNADRSVYAGWVRITPTTMRVMPVPSVTYPATCLVN